MLSFNTQAKQSATRALSAFKNKGFAVDPNNSDHIRSYLAMRNFSHRITPESFTQYLESKTTAVASTIGARIEYWAVPKTNFPDGLPPALRAAVLGPEELSTYELMSGGAVDLETVYVLDKVARRSELGMHVKTLEYLTRSTTSVKNKQDPQIPVVIQTPASERTFLNPILGDPADDAAAANPPRKQLKHGFSEPDDDSERPVKKIKSLTETLRLLRDSIVAAMRLGHWCSEGPLHTDNVQFLLTELCVALTDLTAETPDNAPKIADKITQFLAAEFMSRPMYQYLENFDGVFTKLLAFGTTNSGVTADANLIQALSVVKDDELPDTSVADVASRTRFRRSVLYNSFLEARVWSTLNRARAAVGQDRATIAKTCCSLIGLSESLNATLLTVTTLFDETIPLGVRVQHLIDVGMSAQKLARHWDPSGIIGLAAQCLSETSDLTGTSFTLFVEAANTFIDNDFSVPNPVLKQSFEYMQAVYVAGKPPGPWAERLVAVTLRERLGIDSGTTASDFDPVAEIPSNKDSATCYKLTKEMLKFKYQYDNAAPAEWFQAWKEERERTHSKKVIETDEVKDPGPTDDADATPQPVVIPDEAAAAATESAEPPPDDATFVVGTIVLGKAGKFKDKFDKQRCEITGVLVKHYKVKMLTGPAKGESHKYVHKDVSLLVVDEPQPTMPLILTPGPATPSTTELTPQTQAVTVDSAMVELEDLFN